MSIKLSGVEMVNCVWCEHPLLWHRPVHLTILNDTLHIITVCVATTEHGPCQCREGQ